MCVVVNGVEYSDGLHIRLYASAYLLSRQETSPLLGSLILITMNKLSDQLLLSHHYCTVASPCGFTRAIAFTMVSGNRKVHFTYGAQNRSILHFILLCEFCHCLSIIASNLLVCVWTFIDWILFLNRRLTYSTNLEVLAGG